MALLPLASPSHTFLSLSLLLHVTTTVPYAPPPLLRLHYHSSPPPHHCPSSTTTTCLFHPFFSPIHIVSPSFLTLSFPPSRPFHHDLFSIPFISYVPIHKLILTFLVLYVHLSHLSSYTFFARVFFLPVSMLFSPFLYLPSVALPHLSSLSLCLGYSKPNATPPSSPLPLFPPFNMSYISFLQRLLMQCGWISSSSPSSLLFSSASSSPLVAFSPLLPPLPASFLSSPFVFLPSKRVPPCLFLNAE